MKHARVNHYHIRSLEHLVRSFEDAVVPMTATERYKKLDKGEYPYIPFCIEAFVEQLSIVDELLKDCNHPVSFLDVGCGIGTKVAIARTTFPGITAHGIEITDRYVKFAKKLLNNTPDTKVLKRDALKFNYKNYDIVYFYCPLSNRELQKKLEQRIVNTANVGTYILANLFQDHELFKDKTRLKFVWGDRIFQKVA